MKQTLELAASSIFDYPDASIDIAFAMPYDITSVAEAYQAGSKRRIVEESTDYWQASDSNEAAIKSATLFQSERVLFVRRSVTHMIPGKQSGFRVHSSIAATAVANMVDSGDVELWQDFPERSDTTYIHRLATHPAYRNRRFGAAMIAGIAQQSLWGGKDIIRLDCNAKSSGLRNYYSSLGFESVGEQTRQSNGYHAALFQQHARLLLPQDI